MTTFDDAPRIERQQLAASYCGRALLRFVSVRFLRAFAASSSGRTGRYG